MRAMILAAGFGRRLQPLTHTTPKPLLKVRNKPLIVHLIGNLKKAGITQIVINVHYLGQKIMDQLGNGHQFGVNIEYSLETALLNTGGGILKALPLLGPDPFIVVSGDIYTNFDFSALVKDPKKLAHIVLTPNPECNPTGDFALKYGQIFNEGDVKYNYAGIGLYEPSLFSGKPLLPLSLASDILRSAIEKKQVSGELFTGSWHNVGTLSEFEALNSS